MLLSPLAQVVFKGSALTHSDLWVSGLIKATQYRRKVVPSGKNKITFWVDASLHGDVSVGAVVVACDAVGEQVGVLLEVKSLPANLRGEFSLYTPQ